MQQETKQVSNALILGVGAPNECSSGDVTMCAICLSADGLGLFRVYPIPGEMRFPVWSYTDLSLVRSSSDNRCESWKIEDYKLTGQEIKTPADKRATLDSCILKSGADDPIDYQNNKLRSIAVVKLTAPYGPSLEHRQPNECNRWVVTQQASPNKPMLSWKSQQGKEHTSHLVAREVYMGLANNPTQPWNVFTNMQLNNGDFEHWLVLGNMKDRRNVWVIVHVHRLKKNPVGSTLSCLPPIIGSGDAWPYSAQGTSNVKCAGGQLELCITSDTGTTAFLGNMQTAI